MTTAYTWPKYNALKNGGFESAIQSVGGGGVNNWEPSDTSVVVGSGNANSGSQKLTLPDGEAVLQRIPLWEVSGSTQLGRWISDIDDYLLTLYVRNSVGGLTQDDSYLRLRILDDSDTAVYEYDFHAGKWIDVDDATSAQPFHWHLDGGPTPPFSDTTYRLLVLPRIRSLASAGSDVADEYSLEVYIANASSGDGSIFVDDVLLCRWPANVETEQIGHWTVATNGYNYPIKYDPRGDFVTEISLSPPYHTLSGGTDLPTTTPTTGGSLEEKFYGFAYCYEDEDLGEESAFPFGIRDRSGFFYEEVTSTNNAITVDFTNLDLPNVETARATDNTRITRIRVWRTFGYSSEDSLVEDFQSGNALFYFETELDLSAATSYTSTDADEDLDGVGSVESLVEIQRLPVRGCSIMREFRSRIFTAGGGIYRNGQATVTNGSNYVTGADPTMTLDHNDVTPPTLWNRSVERMWFQAEGDPKRYLIEQYIYEEDNGAGVSETIYLSEPYQGSSGTTAYRIFPQGGKVFYSEENRPYHQSTNGWFAVDGGDGQAITALNTAGTALLAHTKKGTFLFGWQINPGENQEAVPISRKIGCIAPGSGVDIRGTSYWLSAEGVAQYRVGGEVRIVSDAIRDLFLDQEDVDYIVRNHSTQLADDARGIHYWPRQQYLLAVRTVNGKQACDLVLVYNYVFETWDLLRVPTEIVRWFWSSDDEGDDILCFSDAHGNVHQWDYGSADGAGEVDYTGTVTGTATAATTLTLTDTDADMYVASGTSKVFPTGELNLDGAFIRIVAGTGTGQVRRIQRNASIKVEISQPWDVTPDTTSVYEIGYSDMEWNLKSSALAGPNDITRLKKLAVAFRDETVGSSPYIQVRREGLTGDLMEERGRARPSFSTTEGGRTSLDLQDVAGYFLRLSMKNEGVGGSVAVRSLSVTYTDDEQD